MRDLFPGHYRPAAARLREMWSTGLISLDTNVLLDVFRVSDETAKQLLSTLEHLRERLWLPYYVAEEYHSHVDTIVADQVKPYDDAAKRIDALVDSLSSPRAHPFVTAPLLAEAKQVFDKLKAGLEERRASIENLLTENPLKERIAALFVGRIGERLNTEDVARICAEGASRFERKIPPGYADKKDKPEPDRYGDLIIWESLIAKLTTERKPALFVTSDVKEDWFLRISGKTIGPRPELIAEMRSRAGVDFYLYATPGFLNYANEFLGAGVKAEAIREVEDLEAARRERLAESRRQVSMINRIIREALGPEARLRSAHKALQSGRWHVRLTDGRRLLVDLSSSDSPIIEMRHRSAPDTEAQEALPGLSATPQIIGAASEDSRITDSPESATTSPERGSEAEGAT